MSKLHNLFWGDNRGEGEFGNRSIISVDSMKNLHEIHESQLAEKDELITELKVKLAKAEQYLVEEMARGEWFHREWKKSQDQFRKKLILTMTQSGKYDYNTVVFYADEIIKELDRTTP